MSRLNRARRRGNAAIEFALAAPLILIVLAGIVDGGAFLICQHSVGRAARDGARVGAITVEHPPADGDQIVGAAAKAARSSLLQAGYGPDRSSVSARWWQDAEGRSWLTVAVSVQHKSMFGLYSLFSQDVRNEFVIYTQEQIN